MTLPPIEPLTILPASFAWRVAGHTNSEPIPEDFVTTYVSAAVGHVESLCGTAASIASRAGGAIPEAVTVAAAQICRQLWLADRPGGGRPSGGGDPVPQGFAVPQRAMTLLGPWLDWAVG